MCKIETVTRTMKMMNEEFPGQFNVSESRVKIWLHMLKDFEDEIVLNAAMHIVSEPREFPPNIGIFRSLVVNMTHGELEPPCPSTAWGRVTEVITGRMDYQELSDLEKDALKRTGTLFDLSRSQNLSMDRAQFIRAFGEIVKRRDKDRRTLGSVRQLVGSRHEQLNPPKQRALPEKKQEEEPTYLNEEQTRALIAAAMNGFGTVQ